MPKISKFLREDMTEKTSELLFKSLPMIGKRDQKKVKPGAVVVIKWLDALPTTEIILGIDRTSNKFDSNAGLELWDVKRRCSHHNACCDQIVGVVGTL
jgi:hypothetical protein